MSEPQTWCQFLGLLLNNAKERQHLLERLNVSSITLTGWIQHTLDPLPQQLRQLLLALPDSREQLLELIQQEFPDFSFVSKEEREQDEISNTIPAAFYKRVLHTYATISQQLLFLSPCNFILQQALEQLDPQRQGLAIIVASCMLPASTGNVRSLRVRAGRGTAPWGNYLEQQGGLLGAESLTGYTVMSGRFMAQQQLREGASIFPGYRSEWEESAAAAPIMRAGKSAGSLLVCSVQANYFHANRCRLIQSYAELLAVIFDPDEFYELQRIDLAVLPPFSLQRTYFSTFQQRIAKVMKEASEKKQPLTFLQAELRVWQQLEQELLRLPAKEV